MWSALSSAGRGPGAAALLAPTAVAAASHTPAVSYTCSHPCSGGGSVAWQIQRVTVAGRPRDTGWLQQTEAHAGANMCAVHVQLENYVAASGLLRPALPDAQEHQRCWPLLRR